MSGTGVSFPLLQLVILVVAFLLVAGAGAATYFLSTAETTRAQGAEATLTTNLSNEVSRSTTTQASLQTQLTTEVARAEAAEAAITSTAVPSSASITANTTLLNSQTTAITTTASAVQGFVRQRIYYQGPINVASAVTIPRGSITTTATATTYRRRILVRGNLPTVQLVFYNWWSASGVETANANAMTVTASIEDPFTASPITAAALGLPSSTTTTQVMGGDVTGASPTAGVIIATFGNGASYSVSIPAGGFAVSDPIRLGAQSGTAAYTALVVRTCATVASVGQTIPYVGTMVNGNPSPYTAAGYMQPDGGGIAESFATSGGTNTTGGTTVAGDLTQSGTFSAFGPPTTQVYGPSAILGVPQQQVISVLGLFDSGVNSPSTAPSLGRGNNWLDAACLQAGYAYVNGAIAGSGAAQFNVSNQRRRNLLRWVTHVADNGSITDLASTGNNLSAAQLQAIKLAEWVRWAEAGRGIVAFTIPPQCTSSNYFINVTGQAVAATNTQRVAYNTWLRNTTATGAQAQFSAAYATASGGASATGLLFIVDLAALVEVNASNALTLNGGFWWVPQAPAYTLLTGTLSSVSGATVTDNSQTRAVNADANYVLLITSGTGAGQSQVILSNTNNTWTLPAATTAIQGSTYQIWAQPTNDGTNMSGLFQTIVAQQVAAAFATVGVALPIT